LGQRTIPTHTRHFDDLTLGWDQVWAVGTAGQMTPLSCLTYKARKMSTDKTLQTVEMEAADSPSGFKTYVSNLGIKDKRDDFVCVISDVACVADAVFTQNRFAAASIAISRRHVSDGRLRAVVSISKNANAATGLVGDKDARELVEICASELGITPEEILIASTGVIGLRYPMERIRHGLAGFGKRLANCELLRAAQGMMTTDTYPKLASEALGRGRLVGIAKGAGMMEPNVATLLAYFFTDATISQQQLSRVFRRVVDKTFNCLSIDTDTSTSDTVAILANGLSNRVTEHEFERALQSVAMKLVKLIARDGEGATKLVEVTVDRAATYRQAKRVAKSIVNSPLVKTAIHGSDPNWGRVAMAIGKCEDERDIEASRVVIRFGDLEVYPAIGGEERREELADLMAAQEVLIRISLNTGNESARVWGCDLSPRYVQINSDYTT
jgi:glutamate N-acetyltransferase/amino-acid N-acetyltransferase